MQNDGPLDAIGHFGSDSGYSLTGALGMRLDPRVRLEVELADHRQHINSFFVKIGIVRPSGPIFPNVDTPARGSFDFSTLFANLIVDVPSGTRVTPFIGGGVGVVRAKFNGIDIGADKNRIDDSATALGAQILVGVSAPLSSNLDLLFSYRYTGNVTNLDLPNVQRTDRFDYRYQTHSFLIGLRYAPGR